MMFNALLLAAAFVPAPPSFDAVAARVPSLIAAVRQDQMERIKELVAQAKEAKKRGDRDEERRLTAEAHALAAEMHHQQGNRAKAQQAYAKARSFGWTDPPPWGDEAPAPRVTPTPRITPTPRVTQEPDRPRPTETPKPTRVPKRDRFGNVDSWPFYELNPLKSSRNATWMTALGVPPMEEASGIPKKSWNFRMWMELQSSDWAETVNGETSQYHADLHEESFELNYGLTDTMEVGGRISMGELLEAGGDVIRVFDKGSQVVPTGDRAYAVSELVLRGKWAPEMMDFGVARAAGLIEIKVPLAGTDSLLSSGTLDVAFVGLLTLPVMEDVAIHVNAGAVMPLGGSDLFDPGTDPNMFITYGVGGAFKIHTRIALIGQIEGNTPGWSDVAVLDNSVLRITAGGRWKVGDKTWINGGLGMGMDEASGGIMANLSVDFTF